VRGENPTTQTSFYNTIYYVEAIAMLFAKSKKSPADHPPAAHVETVPNSMLLILLWTHYDVAMRAPAAASNEDLTSIDDLY
jgi:hypothetical protein